MRMRTIFGVMLVLSILATSAMAANIPVTGNKSNMQLVNESRGSLDFHMEIGQIQAQDITTKGGDFSRLLIPGFHSSKIEGQPELPMMNRLIAIPVGAEAQVSVRNVKTRMINLADYGITNPVFPAQPSVSKSADLENLPFVHDVASYQKGQISPELAKVVYQGRLRAMDFGRLEISPVAYYPATGELEVVESMDVSVHFAGADKALGDDLYLSTYSPFFEHLYASFAGSKAFQDDYPDRVGDTVTMVVVTPPQFVSQLGEFIQWKTERGFKMITAVTGTPEVGSTTGEIQSYLHDLYNNATPENPAPSFVLFVGDVAQMPTFTQAGDATDRPYCAVDTDLVPDMFYGRFSATNPDQLQAQLDKTMTYDQFTMADPSYLGNVTMIAGVDSGFAPSHGNGQINYGTEHYFNASHGINSNTYLYPASNGSQVPGELIGTYNDGVAFVNYTAHGSQTSWSDPSLSQSNINSLTNADKYFLAIGNCCLTSTYDYGECFGETFLRAPNKGAMGYIGGSNSTYWDEDYWFGVGYHASSQIDGSALPYEATSIGAYDGVFHDHGEAEHLHYVTNDAVVFSGNLAVMESGSSRITYYWNIYNLLGDPSISTYMGVPTENNVGHIPTIFMGQPSLNVTADPGTYVGLTQDGVLVGSGTVDTSGMLDIEYTELLTPGMPVKMVAMAQNKVPYMAEMMVIVPATVTIDPMVIDVNTTTDITVTIMDSDGVVPQAGINVWAEGMGYDIAPVVTDANGVAVISVNYAFGPTLDIVGQDPAETFRLFTEPVSVNALDLTAPDLTVTTDIGLTDAFALNLPGYLHATAGETGGMLYAVMPDGTVESAAGYDMTLTPGNLGMVNAMLAVSGYNLYTEAFDVIEAYGTLAGNVNSAGTPMANVIVNGLDMYGSTVFTATTDASGNYALPEEVLVDTYTIVVDHFGYLHYESEFFVNYGANTFDFEIVAAPSGVLTGTVIDADTYEPLLGTVKVYRTDTGDLYTEAVCDETGLFTTSALPYFNYEIRVRAWHHVPATVVMTIEAPETVKNFALDPTNGDLLMINDTGVAGAKDVKMGGKYGTDILANAYTPAEVKSATQMKADMENMGFFVSLVDAADVDVSTFWDYDLVVLVCGDNTSTLSNTALKDGLTNFAIEGGHILVEGGEVGYSHYGSGGFAEHVLHSSDWNHDSAGNIEVNDADAYVLNNPNPACQPMTLTYSGYGDSDSMVPLADAEMPMSWENFPTEAAMITFDPNPAPEGGQIVYFTFNYMAVDGVRYALLENSLHWLLAQEVGNCSVSGTALLAGEENHSGITVSAIPNGGSVVTGPDGSFSFPGLYAGTYQIRASKEAWATQVVDVTLTDAQVITDVNLVLTPTAEVEACNAPGVAINDNSTVSDTVTIDTAGTISAVDVDVDISHTYQGDLTVTLTSPAGTDVVLHSRSGGTTNNIVGNYPETLNPAGDLDTFIGEDMFGDWTLTVSDSAGGDQGTFNSWCVHVIFDGGVVAVGAMPMDAALANGGMGLSWNYDPNIADGFNVYRRVGSNSLRLNEDLLSSTSGHIEFVDTGEGLSEGQVVFYSYAMVLGGNELGRSEEVEVEFTSGLPTVFALHGNYPNPFNPITTIKFDMPRQAHVKLSVYDIAGRLVKTLVDEVRPAAAHSVIWDGSDRTGRRVASGTYYYVVQSDSFRAVEKMMLVK